ncbi:hypothetical protein DFA_05277 [Cavenderia fasciculata]|uniref:Uncharacterized protein n=1 Tax=Cavenderia fasciculata TaxID=261658 RepID=F4PNU3_CACFS|nr:uncharacterized protein DFA_05277 [Cavenderia fasciculata]EGG23146.1 hypothetical protein DFA_05277 [Cavenderia fasciculata]|eukprot:XP_004360997.1 hypothetical protein DFA_05277 [Cavenderia fasciculata]
MSMEETDCWTMTMEVIAIMTTRHKAKPNKETTCLSSIRNIYHVLDRVKQRLRLPCTSCLANIPSDNALGIDIYDRYVNVTSQY